VQNKGATPPIRSSELMLLYIAGYYS